MPANRLYSGGWLIGEATSALAPTAVYTDPRDQRMREAIKALKARIESVLDVESVAAENPLEWPDTSETGEERDYRRWTLGCCMYLNPSNDLGVVSRATTDSLSLPPHLIPVEAPD